MDKYLWVFSTMFVFFAFSPPHQFQKVIIAKTKTSYMQTAIATLDMDTQLIKKASFVIRAINHPLRKDILKLLHSKSKITVTEIYRTFEIEQSVASQQLAILRRQGFVNTVRDGKCIYYSVNNDRLQQVRELCIELTSPGSKA